MHEAVTLMVLTPGNEGQREAMAAYYDRVPFDVLFVDSVPRSPLGTDAREVLAPGAELSEAIAIGLTQISTPYCALLAPGDILRRDAFLPCVNYLEEHPDVVACGGYVVEQPMDRSGAAWRPHLRRARSDAPVGTPSTRIVAAFDDPEPALTRLIRTRVLRQALSFTNHLPAALVELRLLAITAIEGRTAQLPIVQAMIDPDAAHRTPRLEWLAALPENEQELLRFLEEIAAHLMIRDGIDEGVAQTVLNEACAKYFEEALPSIHEQSGLPTPALRQLATELPGFSTGAASPDLQAMVEVLRRGAAQGAHPTQDSERATHRDAESD